LFFSSPFKGEDSVTEYEVIHAKSKVFYQEFERKADLKGQTHYCPGCGHGVVHKLIADAIQELALQDQTLLVSPVGCGVFAYYYFDTGNVQVAHGRAPAVATGLKRAHPHSIVISYQGDGDLAAIGTAEILHAANRGEHIAVFFVNNAIYGMTGGQMAPTTLVGQTSTTSPWGRRPGNEGFPLKVSELLSQLEAPVYIERVALCDSKNVMRARRAIKKALDLQKRNAGFTLVEILSPCPTIWAKDPVKARAWISEAMIPVFPLGVYRDRALELPQVAEPPQRSVEQVLEIKRDSPPPARESHLTQDLAVKIAGFGGQGVLLLGQIMAEMGMSEGLEVSWLPSYGPEMRSGSAHCHVCLSRERIGSPLVAHPDVLVALNELSLRKFAPQVGPSGLILYNQDALPENFTPPPARVLCLPASEIADLLGSAKVTNMVMLGALLEETGCMPLQVALKVLEAKVKNQALLELDRKALEAGADYIRKQVRVAMSQPDGFAY
jgi:2-oxoisovalerate ferredoxin oxidoreductase beta subunit